MGGSGGTIGNGTRPFYPAVRSGHVTYLLIPLIVLASVVVLFGLLVFLGRFRGGRYLRPLIAWLSKVPLFRRWFQKVSTAAIEKQNPELASALRKMQTVGTNPDPARAQKALSRLTPSERRAYMDAVQEQGAMPEPANRQQRRQMERMQQGRGPTPQIKRTGGKKRR
jgi:hypothetical protein